MAADQAMAAGIVPPERPRKVPKRISTGTAEREAVEEHRAKLVFYALFLVVGVVAAYVIFLLASGPSGAPPVLPGSGG